MRPARLKFWVLPLFFLPPLLILSALIASLRLGPGASDRAEVGAAEFRNPIGLEKENLPVRTGLISGEVKLSGTPVGSGRIRVTKDQDYCGTTLLNESHLMGPDRGLKNAVVYLEGFPDDPIPPGEAKTHVLENRSCQFVPRVMVMRWGDRLVVKNNDPKLHIVHAYATKRTVFNVALPFPGNSLQIAHKINRPGLLQVNCDTHAWMHAYVHVFGHPFFALTDNKGFFSIGDIPAGRYLLKAWHEESGVQSAEVTVPENGEIKVSFDLSNGHQP